MVEIEEVEEGGAGEWWRAMDARQRQTAAMVALAVVLLLQNYVMAIVIMGTIAAYLAARKPTPESFAGFFEAWYKTQYFPRVAAAYEKELRARARRRAGEGNVIEALGDSARGWLQGVTKGLQGNVLCEQILRRPYLVQDRGPVLSVSINLGSEEHPSVATFWGVHESWILAPYLSIDFDTTSILDEQGRERARQT